MISIYCGHISLRPYGIWNKCNKTFDHFNQIWIIIQIFIHHLYLGVLQGYSIKKFICWITWKQIVINNWLKLTNFVCGFRIFEFFLTNFLFTVLDNLKSVWIDATYNDDWWLMCVIFMPWKLVSRLFFHQLFAVN